MIWLTSLSLIYHHDMACFFSTSFFVCLKILIQIKKIRKEEEEVSEINTCAKKTKKKVWE